jgi:hypothetical protein
MKPGKFALDASALSKSAATTWGALINEHAETCERIGAALALRRSGLSDFLPSVRERRAREFNDEARSSVALLRASALEKLAGALKNLRASASANPIALFDFGGKREPNSPHPFLNSAPAVQLDTALRIDRERTALLALDPLVRATRLREAADNGDVMSLYAFETLPSGARTPPAAMEDARLRYRRGKDPEGFANLADAEAALQLIEGNTARTLAALDLGLLNDPVASAASAKSRG